VTGESGIDVGGYPVGVQTMYSPIILSDFGTNHAVARSGSAGKRPRACWRAGQWRRACSVDPKSSSHLECPGLGHM
jgi:hypothetical protein